MEYKNLSPEKQAEIDKIHAEYKKRMQEINRNAFKDYAKITAGGLLQGASMLPVFNIPYVGKLASKTKAGQAVGEARVIFNPDDIDIVRKFYNQPQAIDYLNKIKPNSGAIVDAFNDLVNKLSKNEKKQIRNQWRQYAKDNFIGNSVDIPGYTTVDFTNTNLGKDFIHNLPEYPNLMDNLQGSQYQFSTNYNDEIDRLYDHLTKEDKNRLFDYLIEVVKDKEGKIHHNYKMMKNINRGDKP